MFQCNHVTECRTLFSTPTMPRRSQTPEASKAQIAPGRPSPSRDARSHKKHEESRRRSRSPRGDNESHRHKRRRTRSPAPKPVVLPYKAQPLSKRDYETYKPLFQSYLDIQKQIQLDELDEREVKGRWKSFVSRWYAFPASHARWTRKRANMPGIEETWRAAGMTPVCSRRREKP